MQQNYNSLEYSHTLKVWAIVSIALIFFVFLYKDSIKTLFEIWDNYGTYSHGYMTVLLSVYLTFVCAKENRIDYSKPSVISIICLILVSILWLVSYLSEINLGQALCLPIFVFFTATYFLGLRNFRVLLTPALILLLVMPVWGVFHPVLQKIAIYLVDSSLSFSSLEYQSVGNKIVMPIGIFEIEKSCSGLRFILVGVLLSVVFGFLNYKSYWTTILLVFSSVLIMLIANAIRILIIIAIGVQKGMENPLVQDHASLGWVVFAVFLVPLFVLARSLNPNLLFVEKPKRNASKKNVFTFPKMFFTILFYTVTISLAPLYAQYAQGRIDKVAEINASFNAVSGWRKSDLNRSKWEINYSLYSQRYKSEFSSEEGGVALSVYLYTREVPQGELININNHLIDESKWRIVSDNQNKAIVLGNQSNLFYVNEVVIESDVFDECKKVWYWFDVDGETYTKEWEVKLSKVLMVVKGKSGGAINTLSTSCGDNSGQILSKFLENNYSQIKNLTVW